MDLRKEREQLASLQRKRAGAQQRADDLAAERARISFAAHSGDKAARKRLSEIHSEISAHESELASIDSALAEAARRNTVAAEEERLDARRADADDARQILAEMETVGFGVDESLAAFVERYQKFQELFDALHRLGFAPRSEICRVSLRRVVSTRLGGIGLAELLPPGQRVALSALLQGWTREANAKMVTIGEPAEAAD
jgi:DNA repair exonuclease SbcCD ATPase subunit